MTGMFVRDEHKIGQGSDKLISKSREARMFEEITNQRQL
jgi:hypothetical protein